jgi:hypothetical protein
MEGLEGLNDVELSSPSIRPYFDSKFTGFISHKSNFLLYYKSPNRMCRRRRIPSNVRHSGGVFNHKTIDPVAGEPRYVMETKNCSLINRTVIDILYPNSPRNARAPQAPRLFFRVIHDPKESL